MNNNPDSKVQSTKALAIQSGPTKKSYPIRYEDVKQAVSDQHFGYVLNTDLSHRWRTSRPGRRCLEWLSGLRSMSNNLRSQMDDPDFKIDSTS